MLDCIVFYYILFDYVISYRICYDMILSCDAAILFQRKGGLPRFNNCPREDWSKKRGYPGLLWSDSELMPCLSKASVSHP